MWVEINRVRVADDSTRDGAAFRETALPRLKQMPGFAGAVMLRNRAEQIGVTGTYWQDEASLRAAAPAMETRRNEAAQRAGFTVLETEAFEVVMRDRKEAPAVGQFVRSTDTTGDPAKRDEVVKMITERVLPIIKTAPGYVGALTILNPQTGRSITSSSWASEDALRSSGEAVKEARKEIVNDIGGSAPKVEEWEVVLAEMEGIEGS